MEGTILFGAPLRCGLASEFFYRLLTATPLPLKERIIAMSVHVCQYVYLSVCPSPIMTDNRWAIHSKVTIVAVVVVVIIIII